MRDFTLTFIDYLKNIRYPDTVHKAMLSTQRRMRTTTHSKDQFHSAFDTLKK
jgi:hypothetical protein